MDASAWVLVSTGLVVLMLFGLSLLYWAGHGSAASHRPLLWPLVAASSASLVWAAWGYNVALGDGWPAWLPWEGTTNNLPTATYAGFQMTFAAITIALVYGGDAWRWRPGPLFALFWTLMVYQPTAHWVWHANGWLARLGAIDFAGGTVVHVSAGAAVLACALVTGRRRLWQTVQSPPHTVLALGLLWVGWFGFNGGSALAAGVEAGQAVVATHLAASAGLLVGFALARPGEIVSSSVNGALAGLVAITPAAGLATVPSALAIGLVAALLTTAAARVLHRVINDPYDVMAVHGVGGVFGALATELLMAAQAVAVLAVGTWSFVWTAVLAMVHRLVVGLED
jgi:Amt family ammonium transporter